MFVNLSWCELEEFSNGAKLGGAAVLRALPLLSPSNAWKKGDPAKIFWKYFQNKGKSWSYIGVIHKLREQDFRGFYTPSPLVNGHELFEYPL